MKKEGGRFTPTELGMVVTDLLLESFDDIFDVKYTARMEEELDEIEDGKLDWRAAMAEFYERFDKDLKHAEEHMTDIKRMEKPTDLMCEKCGKPLVIKWGKHGSFHRLHRLSGLLLQEHGGGPGEAAEGDRRSAQQRAQRRYREAAGKDAGTLSSVRDRLGPRPAKFVVGPDRTRCPQDDAKPS